MASPRAGCASVMIEDQAGAQALRRTHRARRWWTAMRPFDAIRAAVDARTALREEGLDI